MAVRNCAEIGPNLKNIMNRLLANDNLVNLLYYTDKDPLSQPHLTLEEKKVKVFNKLIRIVPYVGSKETAQSILSIRVVRGLQNQNNSEFRDVSLSIENFIPYEQWIIKDENLRPFAIMGEIQKSLNNKTIDGLGKLVGGDFSLSFLTDEISSYDQQFSLIAYD